MVSELIREHEEEVYSSLNDDLGPRRERSTQSMLGPLPVPPKALPNPQKPCDCASKESVCDIEGGIKFNPCYMSKHDNDEGMSADLCDVMLDAVWQAGHATAVHAGRAKCMQCSNFSSKFNTDMKDIMRQTKSSKHPNRVRN